MGNGNLGGVRESGQSVSKSYEINGKMYTTRYVGICKNAGLLNVRHEYSDLLEN